MSAVLIRNQLMKNCENGIIDSRYNESTAPATVQAQGRGKIAYIAVPCVLFCYIGFYYTSFISCIDDEVMRRVIVFWGGALNSERTPRNLQMKCERTARKQLVKYGRSTNEFVNEPRGNGEKNKISSLEAVRKRRERSKSEPREFSKNG